jgi:hypothetical protein
MASTSSYSNMHLVGLIVHTSFNRCVLLNPFSFSSAFFTAFTLIIPSKAGQRRWAFQVNWDGMAWGEIVSLIWTLYRAQINESRSGLILTPPTGLSSPMIMGFRFFFGINKYPMTRRSLT